MPAVLTQKQLNLVLRAMNVATKIEENLTEMQAIVAEAPFVGTIVAATLEGSSIPHITPADVTALNIAFNDLVAYMNASNRRDIYRKVKP